MKSEVITIDKDNIYEVAMTDKVVPFIPAGFHSVLRFSDLLLQSRMAPKDMDTMEKISGAIFYGLEIGMTPLAAVQSIAVINGRPSIWGDGALALVRGSGLLDDIEEYYDGGDMWETPPTFNGLGKVDKAGVPNQNYKAVCKITRKGAKRSVVQEFSIGDAMLAGLWNKDGPWRNYTKRMLKMRARSWAMRDEFTDVLRGLVFAEEAQDYEDMRDVTPKNEEPPESPPADGAEAAKAKRGRKPKEQPAPAGNQYQDIGGKGGSQDIIEAEVVSEVKHGEKVLTDSQKADAEKETPPADDGNKAEEKGGPAKETAKVDTVGQTDEQLAEIFLDGLLAEVGPNKPLKDHLKYINKLLMPGNTEDEMKAAWLGRDRFKGATKDEEVFITRLRDYHKDRIAIAKAAAEEEPPADGEAGQGQVFDYEGFLHELDVQLGALKSPDDVNRVYDEITKEPVRIGVINGDQVEDDLKPILAKHLERVDYL